MKDSDKGVLAYFVIAALAFSVLSIALTAGMAAAPSGRRGVMSVIVGHTEFLAWPQTEKGFIKTASGGQVENTDMAFAFVPVGQQVKSYVIIKADPNKAAENVEISADKNAITLKWWETDAKSTIPFRTVSTDGGISWSEPQNISDLPDTPAKIVPVVGVQ